MKRAEGLLRRRKGHPAKTILLRLFVHTRLPWMQQKVHRGKQKEKPRQQEIFREGNTG